MGIASALLLTFAAAGPAHAEAPIRIVVSQAGGACPINIDGRKIDPGPAFEREVHRRLVELRRPNRTVAVILGERNLSYRCLDKAMIAVQRAGLRYRLAVPSADSIA